MEAEGPLREVFTTYESYAKIMTLRAAIASFNDQKNPKEAVCGAYCNLFLLLVSNLANVQHLSVDEWTVLTKWCDSMLFHVKETFLCDVLQGLSFLLEASESVHEATMSKLVYTLELLDCWRSENALLPAALRCIRLIACYGLECGKCSDIGRQAYCVGRVRNPELRRELIQFAFDIGVSSSDYSVIAANMEPIDIRFVQFHGAEIYVTASSSAMKATHALALFISEKDYAISKRPRTGFSRPIQKALEHRIPIQVLCFVETHEVIEADLDHFLSTIDFWSLVFVGKFSHLASKDTLLKAWRVCLDALSASISSAACYCLSRIAARLSLPHFIDKNIVSLFSTLLLQMDMTPVLSPGSVELWKFFNGLQLLNSNFHTLRTQRLSHWCSTQLKGNAKEGPVALAVVPAAHWPDDLDAPRSPRAAIWQLAMAVSSSHEIRVPIWPANPPLSSDLEPLCTQDMYHLVWFTKQPNLPIWALDSALNLSQDWWMSPDCTCEIKQAISYMLVRRGRKSPDLLHYLPQVPASTSSEEATEAILLAPTILGSYRYQRDPHSLNILCQFLAKAPHSREREQLTSYLRNVALKQSAWSRLRKSIAPSLDFESLLQVLKTTNQDIALTMIPSTIAEKDATKLLDVLELPVQRQAATMLAERGASKSEMAARLAELGVPSPLPLSTFVFAWYKGNLDKFPFALFDSSPEAWKNALRGRRKPIWANNTSEDWDLIRVVRGLSVGNTRVPCDISSFPVKSLTPEQAVMIAEVLTSECVDCSGDERSLAISQATSTVQQADSILGRRTLLRGACTAHCATSQLAHLIRTMFPADDTRLALEIIGTVPPELRCEILSKVSGAEHDYLEALIFDKVHFVQKRLQHYFEGIHETLVSETSSLVFEYLMLNAEAWSPVPVDLRRAIEWTRMRQCNPTWYSLLGRMQAFSLPVKLQSLRVWTEELEYIWDHEVHAKQRSLIPFMRSAGLAKDIPPVPGPIDSMTISHRVKSRNCSFLGPQGFHKYRLRKPIFDNGPAMAKIFDTVCAVHGLPAFPFRNLRILSALIEASSEPPDPDLVTCCLEEDREAGLEVVKAWYRKTGELVGPITSILQACCNSGKTYFGLLCVDIYWSALGEVLQQPMIQLQDHLGDKDLQEPPSSLRQAASTLPVSLFDYEMFSTNYLRAPLEGSGLWRLADQVQPLYYSYENAWHLQQWELPPSAKPASEAEIFFNLFRKDKLDFQEAFANSWENPSAARTLANIESLETISLNSSNCRQARELFVRRCFPNSIVNELAQSCRMLRKIGDLNTALFYALRLEKEAPESVVAKVEVANTTWSLGQSSAAIRILEPFKDENPKILVQLAEWAHVARHHSAEVITEYFETAERLAEEDSRGSIALKFANFCDDAYSTMPFVDAGPYQRRLNELESLKQSKASSSSLSKAEQRLKEEENKLHWEKYRRRRLLSRAVTSYMHALSDSSEHFEAAGRVVALWLAAPGHLTSVVRQTLSLVPTLSFVPWANQLVSRLAADELKLEPTLRLLIVEMARSHYYHLIWHLCNLRHLLGTKSQGLNDVWSSLPRLDKIWEFSIQIRQLAHQDTEAEKVLMSSSQKAWWYSALPKLKIPVPTDTIPLKASGDYSDIPIVSAVEKKIKLANGISAPKIITFVLSDGRYPQMLAKGGRDDLRQDAVMQQVVRSLPKDIQPRTYNIVPLGKAGGAIEVVQCASSLMEIVRPFHEANDGRNYTLLKARAAMATARRKSSDAQLSCWSDLKAHIRPVLRLFFFKSFRNPQEWFSARQLWAASTAQMSIVGYILGLGDRHCSNILIDTKTAACIHIDLGIAFGQGQFLAIPERVPFRLTRDVIDGFGAPGKNGKFHAAASRTLSELRRQKVHILSVLDVLKYDALYRWPSRNGSSEAEWALRGVRLKLSDELSIEATVKDLVQQATSDERLAFIYDGWAPFY